ncbi:FUSC family protein [Frondihabitans australicus]|nr:FUSC family protein [Frondihabitans australicus]
MHDIGLVKLDAAGRVLLCLPASMAAGFAVSLLFGLPAIVGIMLGALPAFLSCFVVVDVKTSRVAARCAALYVPFAVALFCSIALREFRVLELVLIVLLLFVQFYASKFGVLAGDFGAGLFAAYLCGLLLPLPLASFPALALIFAVSLAATIVVRSAVFHPDAYRSLMRTRRAFLAWQTRVLESAVDVLGASSGEHATSGRGAGSRELARLRRRRARSHEAALIADGLLAQPGSGPTGETAQRLHSLLFDTEQAVDGIARVATELHAAGAPAVVREGVAGAVRLVLERSGREGDRAARRLLAWADSEPEVLGDARWANAVHRVALLLSDLHSTVAAWQEVRRDLESSGEGVPFESPVVLMMGRPSGAGPVLGDELASGGLRGPWKRFKVSPALRTAIQASISVALVEPIALLLDGQRFYWGVIGVMVVLAGTNSTHDRVRKMISRGAGTVIGGVIGVSLVDLVGLDHPWWTLVIVVASLTLGMYGFGRAYVFWVIGLVVTLCQVYNYSGQFSDSLIAYRLVENLLGGLVAVIVSAVVLPIATGAMIRRAVIRQLASVRGFLEAAGGFAVTGAARTAGAAGDGAESAALLRNASRAVDQATYQLDSVLQPIVRFPTGGGDRRDDATRTALAGVAVTLRGIAYRGERNRALTEAHADQVRAIVEVFSGSLTALSEGVARSGTPESGVARAVSTATGAIRVVDSGEADAGNAARRVPAAPRAAATRAAGSKSAAPRVWRSPAGLITALDESLGDSPDDTLLSYRLHALLRVDEALSRLAGLYGLRVEAGATTPDLVERRARVTASHVRRRFPAV